MTENEFDQTQMHAHMWAIYQGEEFYVIAVSFEEKLFALADDKKDIPVEEWRWVRCENVQLIQLVNKEEVH